MNTLIFLIYGASALCAFFSVARQAVLLYESTNGTRATQWQFLIFNACFSAWLMIKILEMAGMFPFDVEIVKALLILVMASIGFIFYSGAKK